MRRQTSGGIQLRPLIAKIDWGFAPGPAVGCLTQQVIPGTLAAAWVQDRQQTGKPEAIHISK